MRSNVLERLRSLPEVFTSNDVAGLLDSPRNIVDQYIHRWRRDGLITTIGSRKASVHFNNLKDPSGVNNRKGQALGRLLNRPIVLVGGGVLTGEGWTGQYPAAPFDVAVVVTPVSPTVPTETTGNIRIMPRSPQWMIALMENADMHNREESGVSSVSPAMALADALLSNARGTGLRVRASLPWLPEPDDLEHESLPEDYVEQLSECMRNIGASDEEMELLNPFVHSFCSEHLSGF